MNPFDYINSITTTKEDLLKQHPLNEKEYNAYLVNKGLSYFSDTIFQSNEMNCMPYADKKLQYDYLFHSITKKKRFSKWHKKESSADLENIKSYYKVSNSKAEEILRILSPEQLVEIGNRCSRGGPIKNHK